ncbi:TPA: EMYY motif lipoprotein [Staphylococcus argenteus]|uniref:EMYY motif lipoprotein n=1 Tax=Staphylococcus argenteus TaxID=985002 RepID=UPI000507A851|nr:EMYY motif lipoprotein [Staphylococcus argenteus]MBE2135738.1 EMYY motif lipoprotein [Staphylococcus argenteus]MDT3004975.1 EMYY motif lipoprotein [Staphylococcus argenteus]UPO21502.1 EMYY motif lipoprotein [Staphylococcus argenteus]CDR62921.1 lipoprotein [Staphylococcus argenteus]HDY9445076.1 EMYY motif lipoprotein [Staphylococcus argenteus]
MKKIVIFAMLAILIIVICACGNKEKEAQHQFTKQFKDVEQKQKDLQHVMDNIHLKEIDHLSKTDTTDKNSKEFKALQEDVKNHLMPKFQAYYKSAESLPDETAKVKKLKKEYMSIANEKKKSIKQLKTFIDLCNQSIKYNEDILDYTKQFEKNRYKVESEIKLADNKNEARNLTTKLEQNNQALRDTAKKNLDDSKENEVKRAIKNHIMPMIEKQITDINQTNISDKHVNNARKNAIEMYYSLQNYYNTRIETIEVSEKLSKIDVDKLPKKGIDITSGDKVFVKKLEKLEDK